MIVHPKDWRAIGRPMSEVDFAVAVEWAVDHVNCDALSFSGGVDSTLLLYHMLRKGRRVRAYTLSMWPASPDSLYAERVYDHVLERFGPDCMTLQLVNGYGWPEGDEAVSLFYDEVGCQEDAIVAGDGIDELACGYYAHAERPSVATYHRLLAELNDKHLAPLHVNSGNVRVWLPYLDTRPRDVLLQMSVEQKMQGRRKGIVRQAALGAGVPEWVCSRRKFAFAHRPVQDISPMPAGVTHGNS